MRRTNRFLATVLVAVLILALAAPAASAAPWSPASALDGIGRTLAGWWAALTGDDGARGVYAASEVAPSMDPDGDDVTPSSDTDDVELSSPSDTSHSEVAPHIDPNG